MPKKQKKDDRDDNSGSDSEDDNFGEDGPRPLDWLKANMDPTTATGEKEGIVSNNSDEDDVSDDDKDSMSIEVDNGDAASEFIESFVSKRGNTFYRCTLCPSKGPFAQESDVLAFMKGKFFKKQLEKTRKLLKPSKKLTHEQKLALKVKKENRIEKVKARRKEKRKAKVMNLTEEQIKKKKAKFQAKKQRRLARKKSSGVAQ